MSNASVWIGPLVVAVILGAVLAVLATTVTFSAIRSIRALHDQREAQAARERIPVTLLNEQGDAIDAVISELASHANSYPAFPEEIMNMLYRAHDNARLERGRSK